MEKFKNIYRIDSARLQNYDYSQPGDYFITICTKNHENYFGKIENDIMLINDFGKIVNDCWHDLPNHYHNLILDKFVIIPNHIHGIMMINNNAVINGNVQTGLSPVCTGPVCAENTKPGVETGLRPVSKGMNKNNKFHGIPEFIRALKSFSSRRINELRNAKYPEIWQSRYYDRVIRNDDELDRIREYIIDNPANWKNDENYK